MLSPGTPEGRIGFEAIRSEPDEIPGVSPEHRAVEDITGVTLGSFANIAPGESPVQCSTHSGWDALPNNDTTPPGEGGISGDERTFD